MPFPIAVAAGVLARSAVAYAPRFASMLMASQQGRIPMMMVESHLSAADRDKSLGMARTSPVANWAGKVALAAAIGATGVAAAPLARDAVLFMANSPEFKHVVSGIGELYRKFAGENGLASRLKTSDELVEAMRPGVPGATAPSQKAEQPDPKRLRMEAIALSAAIIGVGFENRVDLTRSSGQFESGVMRQVEQAMRVVAPSKLLSQMSDSERHAVATAAMYSSNGAFLKILSSQDEAVRRAGLSGNGRKMAAFAESVPPADQFLNQFQKDGRFSLEAFEQAVKKAQQAAPAMGADLSAGDLKSMLLAASASNGVGVAVMAAKAVADEVAEEEKPVAAWGVQAGGKLAQRMAMLKDRALENRPQPEDAPHI